MGFMIQLHMLWGLMLLLFILSLIFRKQKVTPMLLRLSYLVVVGTGLGMLIKMGFPIFYVTKGLLALVLISMMEIIVNQAQKGGRSAPIVWVIFALTIVLVPLMGYGIIRF